jgi:hypothetical protein
MCATRSKVTRPEEIPTLLRTWSTIGVVERTARLRALRQEAVGLPSTAPFLSEIGTTSDSTSAASRSTARGRPVRRTGCSATSARAARAAVARLDRSGYACGYTRCPAESVP